VHEQGGLQRQDGELGEEELRLRESVLSALRDQGFDPQQLASSDHVVFKTKNEMRAAHSLARAARIERARRGLQSHESDLLSDFAEGSAVVPDKIEPELVQVRPDSRDELLFRYARLHWSIPVSAGYGRRIRFLVRDRHNHKLIGIFGLGDPVFALAARDRWIGWDHIVRRQRLRHVMDAFVLGAVPPYNQLLCGKLIALLVASTEVQSAFLEKYGDTTSRIAQRAWTGALALITTTSALGRSSLYRRLQLGKQRMYLSVGYTAGSGEFHFANGVYADLLAYARRHCTPTAKHEKWGGGWRNRREIIRSVLPRLGLAEDMLYHGVHREVFVCPLAPNAREFLQGEDTNLLTQQRTVDELFTAFRERWLLGRAQRSNAYQSFAPKSLRLWPERTADVTSQSAAEE
jgi:Domain of unknown function (DUF4338)